MAPWTMQERMTLHVLFGHHKLDFYGPQWWALHHDITNTDRTERTCREDYKYSHGKERTKMYPMHILKPYHQYDAEERAAYDKAFQDVIDSAKRQGIALPGSVEGGDEVKEDENEDEEVDEEDADQEFEEENEEKIDENEDEVDDDEKNKGDEDVEMEDADEDYATAQEDGSDGENFSAKDDTTHDDKAVDRFKMPDFPDETMLAQAEFSETRNAREILSTTVGARDITKKNTNICATSAGNLYPLPTHLETVAGLNPKTAAGLSSASPIGLAESAGNTPILPATSSGEPQKHGRRRPKQPKVEIEDEPAVSVETPKRGRSRPEKQRASVGDTDDFFNAYVNSDFDKYIEEKTRELGVQLENGLAKKTKSNTVRNRASVRDFDERLEALEAIVKSSKKPPEKQVVFDPGASIKPKAIAPVDLRSSSRLSARDQDQIGTQVKAAPPEVTLPPVQDLEEAQAAEELPVRSEKYKTWLRENLDRLLFAEPFNMFPNRIVVPGSKRTAPENPLSADERVTNFFFDMFDGNLTKKTILTTFKKVAESDKPGKRLNKFYSFLVKKAEEMSASPRYHIKEVFDSEESPFSNFRLATNAFEQNLKMLHMSDIDYTGVGDQQLVAFAKTKNRHLTAGDIDFISTDDPVFKRGGRVHKLWIRQQECPILGDCKRYNTAHVCIDVMVCQESHCPKCSKDKDIGSQLKSLTTLPRVHSRHIAPGDKFVAPLLKISRAHEKDYKGEFIVDLNVGVQTVELWDGTTQEVVVCDRINCPGCFEALGGIVQNPKAD